MRCVIPTVEGVAQPVNAIFRGQNHLVEMHALWHACVLKKNAAHHVGTRLYDAAMPYPRRANNSDTWPNTHARANVNRPLNGYTFPSYASIQSNPYAGLGLTTRHKHSDHNNADSDLLNT
jgi:hypothetical protein